MGNQASPHGLAVRQARDLGALACLYYQGRGSGQLNAVEPDEAIFPGFSEELRADFATEMTLFLKSILLEERNVRELLTADHTFVNDRLFRDMPAGAGDGAIGAVRVTAEEPVAILVYNDEMTGVVTPAIVIAGKPLIPLPFLPIWPHSVSTRIWTRCISRPW